ncbi:Phosphatidate cytidylyltransferase [Roseovarius albus]|uniref:Phosphatidate cytidylyltransferase n=1 Tax=Roseovarius albus TaxID=1247867 RepID=A0A1X6YH33_9RHOB|nr:phosphatidate cytidylyltransferase [Roseovarius albus]SLN19301.1 Phosphatidate cytidylyltransferase [Roseovarius albus]
MNDHHTSLMALFWGALAVLLLASGIAFFLTRKAGPEGPSDSIQNLNARIQAWWVMVLLLAFAFWWGRGGVVWLFGICSFAALREFVTLTNARRADSWTLAVLFYLVLPLQYYLVWLDWVGLYAVFIPVYMFLLLPVLSALRGDTDNFLIRVAEVQWAAMIAIYCVSYIPALLSLNIPGFEGQNILLVAFLLIVVQASDVLQYTWGKLIGKTKIAPRLSPSKTVEGFVGGAASASLLGALLFWATPFSFLQAGGMAVIITIMGFFGGLVLSAVKRDRGVKDWGHTIAGHGGFMDRLDSLIFAAPVFFHLTRYWWSV